MHSRPARGVGRDCDCDTSHCSAERSGSAVSAAEGVICAARALARVSARQNPCLALLTQGFTQQLAPCAEGPYTPRPLQGRTGRASAAGPAAAGAPVALRPVHWSAAWRRPATLQPHAREPVRICSGQQAVKSRLARTGRPWLLVSARQLSSLSDGESVMESQATCCHRARTVARLPSRSRHSCCSRSFRSCRCTCSASEATSVWLSSAGSCTSTSAALHSASAPRSAAACVCLQCGMFVCRILHVVQRQGAGRTSRAACSRRI